MRGLTLSLALLAAGFPTGSAGASARPGDEFPVVRCPTEFGLAGSKPAVPRRIGLPVRGRGRGLVAYTDTEVYLLAPRGMRCAGLDAADGGQRVLVWPRGRPRPRPHSRTAGLSLEVEPACSGCKAADACPFFTALARSLGFPCRAGIPSGERTSRPRRHLALFADPPRVAGTGWPSGGPDPANGAVGIDGWPQWEGVFRATCTLPRDERSTCTESLDAVIGRYG